MTDPFFNEGRDAYDEGVDRNECPYGEGTDGQLGWQKGYDARAEEYRRMRDWKTSHGT